MNQIPLGRGPVLLCPDAGFALKRHGEASRTSPDSPPLQLMCPFCVLLDIVGSVRKESDMPRGDIETFHDEGRWANHREVIDAHPWG